MYARLSALFPFQDSHHIISSVQQGGYLLIKQVDPSRDAGVYTCIVRSRTGEEARRDMQLSVNSKLAIWKLATSSNFLYFSAGPPVIEPFKFPKNLQEGGRAQISCAVSSGDMPIYFSWKKDDVIIPMSLQVSPL